MNFFEKVIINKELHNLLVDLYANHQILKKVRRLEPFNNDDATKMLLSFTEAKTALLVYLDKKNFNIVLPKPIVEFSKTKKQKVCHKCSTQPLLDNYELRCLAAKKNEEAAEANLLYYCETLFGDKKFLP